MCNKQFTNKKKIVENLKESFFFVNKMCFKPLPQPWKKAPFQVKLKFEYFQCKKTGKCFLGKFQRLNHLMHTVITKPAKIKIKISVLALLKISFSTALLTFFSLGGWKRRTF